jgi:hypothetical protein
MDSQNESTFLRISYTIPASLTYLQRPPLRLKKLPLFKGGLYSEVVPEKYYQYSNAEHQAGHCTHAIEANFNWDLY